MRRFVLLFCLCFLLAMGMTPLGSAPRPEPEWIVVPNLEPDLVGDVDGTRPAAHKALQDTIWIADWSGDGAAGCDEEGWTHEDGRVLSDGALHWSIEDSFATSTGMSGKAAVVGYRGNSCCDAPDGYDNDWYQGIRMEYTGSATLSFDFSLDSEAGFDFLQIETDSACASFERVDYYSNPKDGAVSFRRLLYQTSGLVPEGERNDLVLTDFGPGTHCVYIAFFSDGAFSPCDGDQPTTLGLAVAIDNIVLQDATGTRTEDFEDGTLDLGTVLNMQDSEPFGTWARLYHHVTDNDVCNENTTCSWLWTDDVTPTLAQDPSMAFGPGGYVVHNWLDETIISPWVSLASTSNAAGTILTFRRFPGNFFTTGRLVANWAVRYRTPDDCLSDWGHRSNHNSLNVFQWITLTGDMTPYIDPGAEAIQVRHNLIDRQWLAGSTPPQFFNPGPGPYVDDTRIGRIVLHGPAISEGGDSRSQAQDAFPTEPNPELPPSTGEHFRPSTDRFGTCAFSPGSTSPPGTFPQQHIITGDSIWVRVTDARAAGGVTSVRLYGTIVAGPHAGKAPPPYPVDGQGFFAVEADSVRDSYTGKIRPDYYFVDLDDTYFRGGDQLLYFWMATDAQGGMSFDPAGITALPVSRSEAEAATGGLLEVSFLPRINWSQDYLDRIAADPYGDLDPTQSELAASQQATCILYVEQVAARRRSGAINRTTFMYTLDRLGYAGAYDVYDHQGTGNAHNQLAGRASVEQAGGYALIVYDTGNLAPGAPLMPDNSDLIDQTGWFRSWLAQAASSDAGMATLWLIGSNLVEERAPDPLLTQDMGVQSLIPGQILNANPDVQGVTSFTFQRNDGTANVDFMDSRFALSGGCPSLRDYDPLAAGTMTAVATHVFVDPIGNQPGDATIVMNRNESALYNTIMQSHAWFDIRDADGTPAAPAVALLETILPAVLPASCQAGDPVDVEPLPQALDLPAATRLRGNVPNPFNPATTIHFDLARSGPVSLRIYDVAGRFVRSLIEASWQAGRDQRVEWNGLDAQGHAVPSGVYLCRLEADGMEQTHKMLVLR